MHTTRWLDALPLVGPLALALVGLFAARWPGLRPRPVIRASQVATLVALASAALAIALVVAQGPSVFVLGGVPLLRLDALAVVMLALVATLGGFVIRYSITYLDGDGAQGRFLGALGLTIASVCLLVTAPTLVQLVLFWIATSFGLHRLLLTYGERPAARHAARKKFLMARLGDLALGGAALLLARAFGTVEIGGVLEAARAAAGAPPTAVIAAGWLLVLAAALKSAMFPTHGWLMEVMEAPTPVSALLHAGILNGGVFLVVRLADVVQLAPGALAALVAAGGFTALFASTVMTTQPSIKVALAYSSAAHMGFMLLVCGIRMWPLAIAHLVAHSFYKAHAFLSSGSAVEVTRALGGRKKAAVGIARGSVAVLLGLVVVWGVGFAFGDLANPSVAVAVAGLSTMLGLGLGLLFGLGSGAGPGVMVRMVGIAVGTAASFFALEHIAAAVLAGAVPSPSHPGTAAVVLLGAGVASFAVAVVLQLALPTLAGSALVARLWVHVRNGLYANALLDRVLRPRGRPSAPEVPGPRPTAPPSTEAIAAAIAAAMDRAARTVAPLWPLRHFVAVNPFLGLSNLPFEQAARRVRQTAGATLTMPRSFYAEAHRTGRLDELHLAEVLAEAGIAESADSVLARLGAGDPPRPAPLPTAADLAAKLTGVDFASLVHERVAAWAACYFDHAQASWQSPFAHLPPYEAWRAEAACDRGPEVLGVAGYRRIIAGLPDEASAAAALVVAQLGIPVEALDLYLERLLATIGGFSAYARYLGWDAELDGGRDGTVASLLSVRLAWELVIAEAVAGVREALAPALLDAIDAADDSEMDSELAIDLALQETFERTCREGLVDRLSARRHVPRAARPAAQIAFCIDVRSEVLRRALEAQGGDIETIGFAGFFGFAAEVIPFGQQRGGAQCPVLLKPSVAVRETLLGESASGLARAGVARTIRRRTAAAWKGFKQGAVSCFAFVGPVGLAYFGKLVGNAFGWTRPVPHPSIDGVPPRLAARIGPTLELAMTFGRETGIAPAARIDAAEAVLRAMSMTGRLSRLVVLAGHGSTTVNNPHATGLDCGACGGHTGEANARIAALVLNDPLVRAALPARDVKIPADTIFVAALHDTTTDQVKLFDLDQLPASHLPDLERLRQALAEAGRRARAERAPRLNIAPGDDIDARILERTRDWAQTRPEWGLAGCAAFIAAPRRRTEGLDLAGRAFLHSYAWREDEGFRVLELILTAPVVVASWISLQYYGSTVDSRVYGAGNKVLHNVVGAFGVLEGNGGDLRTGLPWQSVHDGERYVHEPLRLNVFVEAPLQAISDVLGRHAGLRALVDNRWLILHRIDEDGVVSHRHAGPAGWQPLVATAAQESSAA